MFLFLRVKGRENEPKGPYIVCANHSSFLDPVCIAVALKQTQRFIARSSLIRFKFFKWLFKGAKVITINRGNSDLSAIKLTIRAIENGDNVAIFPQGTRIRGIAPSLDQVEAGLGLLAAKTKVPVLPVSIVTKRLYPGFLRPCKVVIGKPIYAEEYMNINPDPRAKEIAQYCFSYVIPPFEEQRKKRND